MSCLHKSRSKRNVDFYDFCCSFQCNDVKKKQPLFITKCEAGKTIYVEKLNFRWKNWEYILSKYVYHITYIDQIHSGGDGGSVNTMGLSNTKMYSLARITFITESRVENSTWEFSHDSIFFCNMYLVNKREKDNIIVKIYYGPVWALKKRNIY